MIFDCCKNKDFSLAAGEVKVIDFGSDGVGGYAVFNIDAYFGSPRVRLSYATHPDGLGEKGDFWRETRATYLGDDIDLPILPASVNRFDIFEITNTGEYRAPLQQGLLRYARIAVESEESNSEVTISDFRFENLGTHSEEAVIGSFTCSDEVLNKIWAASVRTCRMAAIPARTEPLNIEADGKRITLGPTYAYLSDGAKRDRLVWSGDLWFADLNMYYAFGPNSPYMPGSIRMLAENQTPEGYVQACPYPESHGPLKTGDYGPFQSDEFAAWLIPVVYEYWLYTGDTKLVADIMPALMKLMAYLGSHCREDGLFEQRMETSKNAGELRFGDQSTHHRSYMNVLLLGCYRSMGKLVDAVGGEDKAREPENQRARESPKSMVGLPLSSAVAEADSSYYAAMADKLQSQIIAEFGLEGGGLAKSLENPVFCPEATALWYSLPGCANDKFPVVKYSCIWHAKFQSLVIRALFESGYAEEAIKAIYEHNWPKIVDSNWQGLSTTYECMYLATKGWGDEAHPDTAIAGLLSRYVLGIVPTAPGFSKFVFRPPRTTAVSSASGTVPTPFGRITASWKFSNTGLQIKVFVPKGISGTLEFEGQKPLALDSGKVNDFTV